MKKLVLGMIIVCNMVFSWNYVSDDGGMVYRKSETYNNGIIVSKDESNYVGISFVDSRLKKGM